MSETNGLRPQGELAVTIRSPVVRFAFALVGAVQPAPSQTISEYVQLAEQHRDMFTLPSLVSGPFLMINDESRKVGREVLMLQPESLPKTIWILWFQGIDKAPYVVQRCFESWVKRNPGWQVISLDQRLLANVVSMDYTTEEVSGLSMQQAADMLRLDLLANHGGVWVDATCFCVQPLDEWLFSKMESGFFAFDRPGKDRIMSSWFLAAEPGNHLVSKMFTFMRSYWISSPVRHDNRDQVVRIFTRLLQLSPQTRGWWFSRLLRERMGATPYFALHYGFEKLIREDPECGQIWSRTPKVSADGPHRLFAAGLLSQATDSVRAEIDRREVPVYKTTWKLKDSAVPSGSLLAYLLDSGDR